MQMHACFRSAAWKGNSTRSFVSDASEGVEMSLFVRDQGNVHMSGCLPFWRVCVCVCVCSFCREDLCGD